MATLEKVIQGAFCLMIAKILSNILYGGLYLLMRDCLDNGLLPTKQKAIDNTKGDPISSLTIAVLDREEFCKAYYWFATVALHILSHDI